jgi:hypothetical protein
MHFQAGLWRSHLQSRFLLKGLLARMPILEGLWYRTQATPLARQSDMLMRMPELGNLKSVLYKLQNFLRYCCSLWAIS